MPKGRQAVGRAAACAGAGAGRAGPSREGAARGAHLHQHARMATLCEVALALPHKLADQQNDGGGAVSGGARGAGRGGCVGGRASRGWLRLRPMRVQAVRWHRQTRGRPRGRGQRSRGGGAPITALLQAATASRRPGSCLGLRSTGRAAACGCGCRLPHPVTSSCATAARAIMTAVGFWICISRSRTLPSFVSLMSGGLRGEAGPGQRQAGG
jgi:hypothetical protein